MREDVSERLAEWPAGLSRDGLDDVDELLVGHDILLGHSLFLHGPDHVSDLIV